MSGRVTSLEQAKPQPLVHPCSLSTQGTIPLPLLFLITKQSRAPVRGSAWLEFARSRAGAGAWAGAGQQRGPPLSSQPCRALYLFAKSNNIPFEFKRVELMKGQHKSKEFRKVNPMMKVPALEDGSFLLSESIAILLYLARKFKTPDHWYPSDLQKRARVDEYLSWQHANIRAKSSDVFVSKFMLPVLVGQPLPPKKLEEIVEELNTVLKQFEVQFLQDKPFIAGSEVSLADLVALVELMQPVGAGHNLFEEKPKLAEWRSRVEAAVGPKLFEEAHQTILKAKYMTPDKIPPVVLEVIKSQALKQIGQA
ncbi:PREDICTED: glutathione S-transferase theta-1-like [Tinamus guttatus]|nr:PREDICTED: glutathione S-transferase theta-1-like [Tinamus guttatus]